MLEVDKGSVTLLTALMVILGVISASVGFFKSGLVGAVIGLIVVYGMILLLISFIMTIGAFLIGLLGNLID